MCQFNYGWRGINPKYVHVLYIDITLVLYLLELNSSGGGGSLGTLTR